MPPDRHAEFACGVPQRREPGIIGQHEPVVRVAHVQPEVLPHLHPRGAGRRLGGEVGNEFLAATAAGEDRPVDVTERGYPAGKHVVEALQIGLQFGAPSPVEIDEAGHVELCKHRLEPAGRVGDEPFAVAADPVREPAAEMAMGVDSRKPGAAHAMLGQRQPRPGEVPAERELPQIV